MLAQATVQARTIHNVPGHPQRSERPIAAETISLMGASMSFPRNAEIYGENEPAEFLYKLISGAVRTSRILEDGRRQIGSFCLPGDIFGLEVGSEHLSSAEAISEVRVLVIKRSALLALAARDNGVANHVWSLSCGDFLRMQRHMMLLVKSAEERVANFLLEIADRTQAKDHLELAMTRQDIADYLGLTIETVSRTLTHLETAAAIDLPTSRRVVLRDRAALRRLNA